MQFVTSSYVVLTTSTMRAVESEAQKCCSTPRFSRCVHTIFHLLQTCSKCSCSLAVVKNVLNNHSNVGIVSSDRKAQPNRQLSPCPF
ncbi:hypothetical protein ACP70R_036127 [Stipagrostis hirtigluma subsp. patula]